MKNKFYNTRKIILSILILLVVFLGVLYVNNDIGVLKFQLEEDIRLSQKIKDDWLIEGMASDAIAAYISYPEDQSDHTFSVYVNRPGISFGYFFRGGGNASVIDEYIAEFSVEGYNEHAFISMNKQKIDHVEIDDGNSDYAIDIDSGKPFAIVLPINTGEIKFFDVDGNEIDTQMISL